MTRKQAVHAILGHRGPVGDVGAAMIRAAAPIGAEMGVRKAAWGS